nr:MAG TPA: hypothetical protein [Caudoviricetes sp.]
MVLLVGEQKMRIFLFLLVFRLKGNLCSTKLTGAPDTKTSPQGSGKIKWKEI